MPIYSSPWVCWRLEREMLCLFLFFPVGCLSGQGDFWGLNMITWTLVPIGLTNCVPIKPVLWGLIYFVCCLFNARQVICAAALTDKKKKVLWLKLFPVPIVISERFAVLTTMVNFFWQTPGGVYFHNPTQISVRTPQLRIHPFYLAVGSPSDSFVSRL